MIEDKTEASKEVAEAKEERTVQDAGKASMQIKVYSPYRVYFDETSRSISAENATGPFDILPHHHNFLTLLSACDLVIQPLTGDREQKIRISGGLMHVKADKVTVFLDI